LAIFYEAALNGKELYKNFNGFLNKVNEMFYLAHKMYKQNICPLKKNISTALLNNLHLKKNKKHI